MKILAAILALLCLTGTARAEFQIQEPEVEAGEVEFQFINGWALDTPKGDDLELTTISYEPEIQLGITDYLMIEIGLGIEKELEIEDGEKNFSNLILIELEFGLQLELFDVARHGFGLALVAGFTKSQTPEENDSVDWGAIAKLAQGPVSLTSNTYFSDPRTDDASQDHVNFEYGVQLLYQLNDTIGLALEAIGEIDNIYNPDDTDTQPHRLGPLVYLSWERDEDAGVGENEDGENGLEEEGTKVTFGLGALFGLTSATPDTTIKADIEISF